MSFLLQWLDHFTAWIWNAITTAGHVIVADVLAAVVTVVQAIPVPAWMTQVTSWVSEVPPLLAYILAPMHFGQGIAIVGQAYLLRYLLRRVP